MTDRLYVVPQWWARMQSMNIPILQKAQLRRRHMKGDIYLMMDIAMGLSGLVLEGWRGLMEMVHLSMHCAQSDPWRQLMIHTRWSNSPNAYSRYHGKQAVSSVCLRQIPENLPLVASRDELGRYRVISIRTIYILFYSYLSVPWCWQRYENTEANDSAGHHISYEPNGPLINWNAMVIIDGF